MNTKPKIRIYNVFNLRPHDNEMIHKSPIGIGGDWLRLQLDMETCHVELDVETFVMVTWMWNGFVMVGSENIRQGELDSDVMVNCGEYL